MVTTSSIRRALVATDYYLHNLSEFQSYHLVYVDESGSDKRVGFRRTGWATLGRAPLQVTQFHRDQRYQMLPEYAQDGIVLSRVFRGSTDAIVFKNFIAQLLQHCGRWPEPKSVLVMDNASFHHSERLAQMCVDAGVKLVYLPPYSPSTQLKNSLPSLKVLSSVTGVAMRETPAKALIFSSNGVSMWSVQKKRVPKAIFAMRD
ncbi:hypothetical protein N7517_003888 [Penicillium concentricum]|uniref:Tc1-like transposase DDE domain-containing protein n=1 Tax=Penicillium concentricum TaxID=293559 RepID=A0A9W9S560_9EURO|nr:uncharacterized protein N7517_003888 [Penicillium concentricum]KAJ5371882.1 hypothetical protein N7517_003888 [Penicillium concentricum]